MIINFDYKRFITSNYEIILMTSIIIRNKYELNFSQASILPLITIYKITIYVYIYIVTKLLYKIDFYTFIHHNFIPILQNTCNLS